MLLHRRHHADARHVPGCPEARRARRPGVQRADRGRGVPCSHPQNNLSSTTDASWSSPASWMAGTHRGLFGPCGCWVCAMVQQPSGHVLMPMTSKVVAPSDAAGCVPGGAVGCGAGGAHRCPARGDHHQRSSCHAAGGGWRKQRERRQPGGGQLAAGAADGGGAGGGSA